MQELSMNILDIAENSVRAGASLVEITLTQDTAENRQTLTVRDNGKGMDAEMVAQVTDPFTTTRTTRKVGLGLPFLKMAAEQTGGGLVIDSTPGLGTTVTASFTLGHIDLMPLGDIGGTIAALVQSSCGDPAYRSAELAEAKDEIDFVFTFTRDGKTFAFSTKDARQILEGVPLSEPAVAVFIKDHITEGVQELTAGNQWLPD
ncbi:ATP-binding protein [Ruminococcaceae bacterium OttesenSCG-928-D13]|nr:ATP-binding protein [Ruminococcaceae bacterium OttesenSCG-928-D13]